MGILAYFLFRLAVLIQRGNNTIAKKSFYRDLDKGIPENYSLGESSFDFSFKIYNPNSVKLTPDLGYFEIN